MGACLSCLSCSRRATDGKHARVSAELDSPLVAASNREMYVARRVTRAL